MISGFERSGIARGPSRRPSTFWPGRLLAFALASAFLAGFSRAEIPPAPQSGIENRDAKVSRPYLWKIERPGAKPSWLFGTIHLPRPDVTKLPPVVRNALDGADAVYTEIPADMATMLSLLPKMMLPNGRTVDKVLGPALTAELEKEARTVQPGFTLAPLARFKPWAVLASLLQLEDQAKYPGALALDMIIFQRAAMAGKEVGGIETPDEQIAVLDSFSDEEQVLMVRDSIEQLRAMRAARQSVSDFLAQLYLAGDLDKLVSELSKLDEATDDPALTAKYLDLLLYRRNERMAARMAEKMRDHPGRSYFFAVGAAHLQGGRGLLAALAKAGFELSRVQ